MLCGILAVPSVGIRNSAYRLSTDATAPLTSCSLVFSYFGIVTAACIFFCGCVLPPICDMICIRPMQVDASVRCHVDSSRLAQNYRSGGLLSRVGCAPGCPHFLSVVLQRVQKSKTERSHVRLHIRQRRAVLGSERNARDRVVCVVADLVLFVL